VDIGQNRGVQKGVRHFEHKFQREWGVVQRLLASENYPWIIMWHCLRDPTFGRFDTILACDGQTYTAMANNHASTALRE